ncbi:hypothetical protein [Alistipes finegoldii]|uniref:hypothetical protein n=1 Tax=Alistipes finegoldii TaxID=214856 RepID=UPI00243172E8|nr:hypothetical protein [Alistipes finegoldii]
MNSERRKKLQKQIDKLNEIKEAIEVITQEEQFAYDNMPEGLRESERGSNMYDNITDLENMLYDLSESSGQIETIINR